MSGFHQVNIDSALVPILSLELLRKKSQSLLGSAEAHLGL